MSYSTRQTKSFEMVQVRINLKAVCLSVHGVKLWNTLSDAIKNCTSVNIFKKCIKKHFLSHYYTTLHCTESIICTALFEIDHSVIIVIYSI